MDHTVEGYNIRIEVREDEFVNYSIIYIDHDGNPQESYDQGVTMDYALQQITVRVRGHVAGAF
jgi:hypothetical protein